MSRLSCSCCFRSMCDSRFNNLSSCCFFICRFIVFLCLFCFYLQPPSGLNDLTCNIFNYTLCLFYFHTQYCSVGFSLSKVITRTKQCVIYYTLVSLLKCIEEINPITTGMGKWALNKNQQVINCIHNNLAIRLTVSSKISCPCFGYECSTCT